MAYILQAPLVICLEDSTIEYNVLGSVVTFKEIKDKNTRDILIKSFLENGYISDSEFVEETATTTAKAEETPAEVQEAPVVEETAAETTEESAQDKSTSNKSNKGNSKK